MMGKVTCNMQKILGLTSILLMLLFSSSLHGEVFTILEQCPHANRILKPTIRTEFDFPIFDGSEEFSSGSERVAAFATGWRQWRGYPRLNDDDVLCYISKSLNCPFIYVFYSYADRNCRFLISDEAVWRDEKPYAIWLYPQVDINKYGDEILKSVQYLLIDSDCSSKVIERVSERCDALRYICILGNDPSNCTPILEECPIEYAHFMPRISMFEKNNIYPHKPDFITARSSVTYMMDDTDINNIRMPYLKYMYARTCDMNVDYKKNLPSIKGIIIGSIFDEIVEEYICKYAENLRILHIASNDASGKMIMRDMPSVILDSESLEFLNTSYYKIPEGKVLKSKNIRMLISACDSSILSRMAAVESIEVLSVKKVVDYGSLLKFTNLKILDVFEISNIDEGATALKLREFRIDKYEQDTNVLEYIIESCPNGEVYIGGMDLENARTRFSKKMHAKLIAIEWMYDRPIDELAMSVIRDMSESCSAIEIVLPLEKRSGLYSELIKIRNMQMLICHEGIYIPQRYIEITAISGYASFYIADYLLYGGSRYSYRGNPQIVCKNWFKDTIIGCRVVE